jgi:hypothetical protein
VNFGFVWWLFFVLISSFILPKSIKYRLYNLSKLYDSLYQSSYWTFLQVRALFKSLYKKSWQNFYNYVVVSCFSQNLLFSTNNFQLNPYFTLSEVQTPHAVSLKAASKITSLTGSILHTGAPLLGLFKKSVPLDFLKSLTEGLGSGFRAQGLLNPNFSQYESLFSLTFNVNSLSGADAILQANKKPSRGVTLIKSLFILTATIISLFLLLYFLILIFYKLGMVIPRFINFDLIGLTLLLFSITNSHLLLSKEFVDFILMVSKAEYNSLNEPGHPLYFQQKYFLKHESTYFLDKKCSEN